MVFRLLESIVLLETYDVGSNGGGFVAALVHLLLEEDVFCHKVKLVYESVQFT